MALEVFKEGKRLDALYKVKDPEIKDAQSELRPLDYWELDSMGPLIRQPYLELVDFGGIVNLKYAVKRKAMDIWECKDYGKVKIGGAYTLNTASAVTVRVRSTIRSLSEKTES
ncbi:hypothetical protein Q3G72_023264 [Acer saccharum]|nr:hypothetical protein Q3G72_000894 [Acer saccharum]KAK1592334.1 hypothetical protein Q3G72_023264 [Acer saccharum]